MISTYRIQKVHKFWLWGNRWHKGDNPYFLGYTNLNRGVSKNLELGYILSESDWKISAAIFNRWDKDILDFILILVVRKKSLPSMLI